MSSNLQLGKKPATHDPRDLEYEQYRAVTPFPALPHEFGQEALIDDWGVLGNDRYGDCVWAGGDHETMLWNASVGRQVIFDDDTALADYASATGFDPKSGSNDNGTDMREAMNYRRKNGLIDVNDDRHKIAAYVALEPGNWNHVMEALYLFGVVAIGIEFPDTAFDQFERGKPWTVRPGANIEGGHYVPLVGRHSHHVHCVTWGKIQPITMRFFEKYCDEAYAPLSEEMLSGGRSLQGFDIEQLQKDLSLLGKRGEQPSASELQAKG